MQQVWTRTIEFLKDQGLNPNAIVADSLTELGYTTFIFDADGRKIIGPDGETKKEFRRWPQGIKFPNPANPTDPRSDLSFGQMVMTKVLADRHDGIQWETARVRVIDPDTGEPHTIDKLVLMARQMDMFGLSMDHALVKLWHSAMRNLNEKERETYDALYRKVSANHTDQQIAGEGVTP